MKKLLPKLILAIMAPLVVLGAAEWMLRAFRVGYPTAFLQSANLQGNDYHVNNPFYGYRFFDHRIARNPAPIRFTSEKQEGITRIAILGESAAMGDPAIEFSLARGLDKMLNEPGEPKRFDVINAAMTAINSPVIVDIAEDLAACDVDVFVIYMGNNEVVGPFGPGTILTRGNWSARFTPWRVRLSRLRLTGVLRQTMQAISLRKNTNDSWGGMEMFEENRVASDDPRLQATYRSFAQNLNRILAIAQRRDIHVILCTMAVNLTDCPPFSSTNCTDFTTAQLREWNKLYRDGRKAQQEGRYDDARIAYQQALDADHAHAELVYRLAQINDRLGEHATAGQLFQRARDLDTQRFRADSEINRAIRRAAEQNPSVALIDIEQSFGLMDDKDLFVDHVHFSMTGLYHLCRNIIEGIPSRQDVTPFLTQSELMSRLMRTPWSDRKEATSMYQRRERPPFSMQWGNKDHLEKLSRQADQANARIADQDIESVGAEFAWRMNEDLDDLFYASQWGHILCVEEQWSRAASVMKIALERMYGFTDMHSLATLALAMHGEPKEAAEVLLRTGPPYGFYMTDAALNTIAALRRSGKPETASAFAHAILTGAPRFPGRESMVRAIKP